MPLIAYRSHVDGTKGMATDRVRERRCEIEASIAVTWHLVQSDALRQQFGAMSSCTQERLTGRQSEFWTELEAQH